MVMVKASGFRLGPAVYLMRKVMLPVKNLVEVNYRFYGYVVTSHSEPGFQVDRVGVD